MKKIITIIFLQSLFCFVSSASEKPVKSDNVIQNDEPRPIDEVAGAFKAEHQKPPKFAALPTGKTLPKGFFRVDIPTAYTFGENGFSSSAKRIKNGFWIDRWMTGFLFQYGISDTVSIGIGVPIVLSNKMGLDGNEFAENSEFYKKYYDKSILDSATFLADKNNCNGARTTNDCINEINNGLKLSAGSNMILPTGEIYRIQPDIPVKDQVRDLIINSTIPENGNTGLGDFQVGLLWNPLNEVTGWGNVPLFFSIGGGLRFPTGKFDIPMAFRQTGGDGTLLLPGGTLDGIIRWNLDYEATPGFFLSWENQMEYSFTKPVLNRSSMITPGEYNKANPELKNPLASPGVNQGDGVPNTLRFERKGVRFFGYLEADWGLGNVTRALKEWALYTKAKYNIMSTNYLNDAPVYLFQDQFYLYDSSLHPNYGPQQAYSILGGLKVSGLPDMFPLEFSVEYEYLFAGKNLFIAPMNLMMVLAVYF